MKGSRDVPGLPGWPWLIATFVVYVALGLLIKSAVLNWIVGPLWLVATLYVMPLLFGRRPGRDA